MSRTLQNLKVKDLKHLAFLTGCQLSTTKASLQTSLLSRLRHPLVNDAAPRVVSVDMGIRNLAYCVVDLARAGGTEETAKRHGFKSSIKNVTVSHWQKLDLVAQLQQVTGASNARNINDTDSTLDIGDEPNTLQAAGIFTPPVISQIALSFVQVILSHRPSTILIERQRFRSGGGSAIQEWTVRVNMLESMLWACLATVKQLSKTVDIVFPAVHSVEPARVAKFWVGVRDMPLDIRLESSRADDNETSFVDAVKQSKITKAQRIAILRDWISRQSDGLSALEFTDQAKQTVEAFASSRSRAKLNERVGKLDDLTDCLLQAMAWMRWEANRREINTLLHASNEKGDSSKS